MLDFHVNDLNGSCYLEFFKFSNKNTYKEKLIFSLFVVSKHEFLSLLKFHNFQVKVIYILGDGTACNI